MEHQAEHRGRQEADEEQADEAPRAAFGGEAAGDVQQALAVVPAHREDRPELDHDLEHLAGVVVVAEQVAEDDQVPGGRDRQELGEALDDAEHEGGEEEGEVHAIRSGGGKSQRL